MEDEDEDERAAKCAAAADLVKDANMSKIAAVCNTVLGDGAVLEAAKYVLLYAVILYVGFGE